MSFQSLWSTVSRRSAVIFAVLAIGLLAMSAALGYFKPTYSATAQVLLVDEQSQQRDPLVRAKDLTTLATSSTVLQNVRDELGLSDDIAALRSHLRVLVVVDSNVMAITFRSHSQALAVKTANAVADSVVSTYHAISSRQYSDLTSRLRLDLAAQQANISRIDRAYQGAVARGASTGDDQSLDLVTAQLDTLQAQRNAAYASLESDAAQADSASTTVRGSLPSGALQDHPEYGQLAQATGSDAARLALLRSRYSSKYPGLPDLTDQVQRETNSLRQARQRVLQSEVADDRTRVENLDQQVADAQQRLSDSTESGLSADVLRAQRVAAENTYQTLSTSLGQAMADEAEAASLGSAVVIDRAIPMNPLLATLQNRIAIAFLFVLALALASAFLVDALDPRFDTGSQIEKVYGRPILALLKKR